MKTPAVRFLKSAVEMRDLPADDRPEIAIIGRSNAGKSSLINGMYNTRVAKVSAQPGKTRTINFFQVGDFYRVVDMPGYGYAARSEGERTSWQDMVEDYLATRTNLRGIVLVIDIRRDWEESESQLVAWLKPRHLDMIVALTKMDKLGRSQITARCRKVAQQARIPLHNVFASSVLKKQGLTEIEAYVFQNWVKSKQLARG